MTLPSFRNPDEFLVLNSPSLIIDFWAQNGEELESLCPFSVILLQIIHILLFFQGAVLELISSHSLSVPGDHKCFPSPSAYFTCLLVQMLFRFFYGKPLPTSSHFHSILNVAIICMVILVPVACDCLKAAPLFYSIKGVYIGFQKCICFDK